MQQIHAKQNPGEASASPAMAEEIAIWALRRIGGWHQRCQLSGAARLACIERELSSISVFFNEFFNHPAGLRPMQLGAPGYLAMTKDERRLLNAIAASQAGDAALLDNYLYRLALDRTMRRRLAEAVQRLAACLAVHGYWLPRPPTAAPIPGAALAVARVQGRDMQDVRVAWP